MHGAASEAAARGDGISFLRCELLKAPGIDVNLKTPNGETALLLAVRRTDLNGEAAQARLHQMVREMLALPGMLCVNAVDKTSGRTALIHSICARHDSVVTTLLAAPGINVG